MAGEIPARARGALLRWYAAHRRPMPWRVEPGELADPYAVLVSETMLQQTQVATVVPYFQRFMSRFPTLDDLARAPEQQVLSLWQGLGYYRRARLLHAAAKSIVKEHRGGIPDTVESLRELPGIGRYTAGAVASIAFGRAAAAVDGNVARVLRRLSGARRPIGDRKADARCWELMGRLVRVRGPNWRPGDVNQAVMELGATVCTPRGPRCTACPVSRFCAAHASGNPGRLGGRARPKPPRHVVHRIVALRRGDHWLFERRDNRGLWGGMWQLPTRELTVESTSRVPEIRAKGEPRPIGSFVHRTTHRRILFEVYWAQAPSLLDEAPGVWRRLDELDDLPMGNAQKRAVELLRNSMAPRETCQG